MNNGETADLHSPDKIAAEIASLNREIASLKREIDDLRVFAKQKPDKPWFLDGGLLVAIAAFVFTMMTAYRQDVNDTRVQLKSVLKELYSMPELNAEAFHKFGNTAVAGQISAGLEAQNQVLSTQAYELANHLGRSLSIPERVAVASAIMPIEPRLAEKLLLNAQMSAEDIENFLAAKRGLGEIQIVYEQKPALGDASFQSAEDALKQTALPLDNQYKIAQLALSEMMWGGADGEAHLCPKALPHLVAAQKIYLPQMVPEAQKMFVPQLQASIARYNNECQPPLPLLPLPWPSAALP